MCNGNSLIYVLLCSARRTRSEHFYSLLWLVLLDCVHAMMAFSLHLHFYDTFESDGFLFAKAKLFGAGICGETPRPSEKIIECLLLWKIDTILLLGLQA